MLGFTDIFCKKMSVSIFDSFIGRSGHVSTEVSTAGIKLIPSYIDKVVSWPQPTTRRDLALFWGFSNDYHEFLPDLAKSKDGSNAVKLLNGMKIWYIVLMQ